VGSKGSNTTTTTQNQTYTPAGASYITNALDRATSAANQPFNLPVAPVAGFTPQQQQAFDVVGQNYNAAQPYFQQAGDYFRQSAAGPNVSQFFNPYASAVTDQLKDVFGQQMSQTTGKLTQAAGGVGADRIAVGQANLAREQGLAAGQTLAQLYQPALSAALQEQQMLQSAGYGTAAVGSGMQSNALQGAQALLGSGGLQQQQTQAQLNAPYQWQVQQAQFPYQQAQFLAGITGSLAPGLGGTTAGQGTTTAPAPSLFSQILGLGTAGIGALGGSGAFGSNGWMTGSNTAQTGATYGGYGSGSNGWGSMGGVQYPAFARGGAASPYAIDFTKGSDGSWGYAGGGEVSDDPINVLDHPVVPDVKLAATQPHMPQLNLNPPQQSGGGGGGDGGIGGLVSTAMKFLPMMLNTGGAVDMKKFDGLNPYSMHQQGYADGGSAEDVARSRLADRLRSNTRSRTPLWRGNELEVDMSRATDIADDLDADRRGVSRSLNRRVLPGYAAGGAPDDDVINPDEPYRLAGPEAMDEWRKGVATDAAAGLIHPQTGAGDDLPPVITQGAPAAPPPPQRAMAFAPQGAAAPSAAPSPYAPRAAAPAVPTEAPAREKSFMDSPWAALMAAGLGIASGTSPFALTNIGQGGLQGLKTLEEQRAAAQKQQTIDQAARRLEQEAKFHEDQYSRMTPYQQRSLDLRRKEMETGVTNTTYLGPTADGTGSIFLDKRTGNIEVKPIQIAGKEKQLPAGLQKDLGEKAASFNQLSSLESGFKPDYAGYGIAGVGDLANWTARQFNVGNTDAADWWQQYQAYRNKVRHEMFGAALTGTETAQWEKQDINPGMQPDRIKANIQRQREIIEGALRRRAASLAKQGYSKDAIKAEMGERFDEAARDKDPQEAGSAPRKAVAKDEALDQARAAIAKGAPRDAVIKRLRENGIDPTGL
jgi:hypothetical protein